MPGFWFDIWCVSFLVSWQSKSFLLAGVLGCIMGRTKTMSSVCVCFCYPSFSEPYHSSSNPLNKWNVINIWIVQDLIPNKTHSEDFWTNQNELGTQPHGHLVRSFSSAPALPAWLIFQPSTTSTARQKASVVPQFRGTSKGRINPRRISCHTYDILARLGQKNQVQLVYSCRWNRSICLPKGSWVL